MYGGDACRERCSIGSSEVTARFCRLSDGSRVAFASVGEGPALVMVPGWLCHLQESWTHPSAASARDRLASSHRFVWYDRLGCGLSDRDGFELSLDNDVEQLTSVLDAADVGRVRLVGYSFGAPAAVVFAARHPERVERLVLYSAFARGSAVAEVEQQDALAHLIRTHWGLGSRTLASILVPNGSANDLRWFDRFQRTATSAEMAVRLLDHLWEMDVRELLPQVRVPTLVLHNGADRAVPLSAGQEVAALTPGAELRVLDGNEHDPFIRDSGSVVEQILAFVEDRPPVVAPAVSGEPDRLTPREREVLRRLAAGLANKQIAATLGIAVATVERHVTNIYRKLDANGRADAAVAAVGMGLVTAERTG